jgi:hypothetical protein
VEGCFVCVVSGRGGAVRSSAVGYTGTATLGKTME